MSNPGSEPNQSSRSARNDMPVPISNLGQNPKPVKVIPSGTNIQSSLARIGMPMIVRRSGNTPEIMTVSAILGYKQISQISKGMPVPFN